MKRYFNQVEWPKIKDQIELKEFKTKFNVDTDLIDGEVVIDNNFDKLELLNDKLTANIKKKFGADQENGASKSV